MYSNPGTKVRRGGGGVRVRVRGRGYNKAFGAVSQKDLTRVKFRL